MSSSPRCYTLAEVLEMLQLKDQTFRDLIHRGQLPFIEELLPRMGRRPRYRADLIDRYLAGQWNAPRFFAGARR